MGHKQLSQTKQRGFYTALPEAGQHPGSLNHRDTKAQSPERDGYGRRSESIKNATTTKSPMLISIALPPLQLVGGAVIKRPSADAIVAREQALFGLPGELDRAVVMAQVRERAAQIKAAQAAGEKGAA